MHEHEHEHAHRYEHKHKHEYEYVLHVVSVCTLPYLTLSWVLQLLQNLECLDTVRVRVRVRLGKGRYTGYLF